MLLGEEFCVTNSPSRGAKDNLGSHIQVTGIFSSLNINGSIRAELPKQRTISVSSLSVFSGYKMNYLTCDHWEAFKKAGSNIHLNLRGERGTEAIILEYLFNDLDVISTSLDYLTLWM